MAIRVLLDHGVRQDHIIFVTFLVARKGGICVLRKAFPQVKIVSGAADESLTEMWLEATEEGEGQTGAEARKVWVVQPGMGHIGKFASVIVLEKHWCLYVDEQGIATICDFDFQHVYGRFGHLSCTTLTSTTHFYIATHFVTAIDAINIYCLFL